MRGSVPDKTGLGLPVLQPRNKTRESDAAKHGCQRPPGRPRLRFLFGGRFSRGRADSHRFEHRLDAVAYRTGRGLSLGLDALLETVIRLAVDAHGQDHPAAVATLFTLRHFARPARRL
ncbi:hypothetical protein ES705_38209 [subsurface metagenome]